jgi:hypothetical protein
MVRHNAHTECLRDFRLRFALCGQQARLLELVSDFFLAVSLSFHCGPQRIQIRGTRK